MGAGGIIQQRAAVLLVAVAEHSMYEYLSASEKSVVNAIDSKDPMSRTQEDVDTLYDILSVCKSKRC